MARWGQLGFQDAASVSMMDVILLHDTAMLIVVFVLSLVGYCVVFLLLNNSVHRFAGDAHLVEIVWSVFPAVVLMFMALPSLRVLYTMEEYASKGLNGMTLKVTGRQWYWNYSYSDGAVFSFDSFMIPTSDLEVGEYRLLDVDKRVVLPEDTPIRVVVTSADVIHCWSVPAFGVKADAVPGRLNQLTLSALHSGVFYGSCSEICGANHSFMPIVVEVVGKKVFLDWLAEMNWA